MTITPGDDNAATPEDSIADGDTAGSADAADSVGAPPPASAPPAVPTWGAPDAAGANPYESITSYDAMYGPAGASPPSTSAKAIASLVLSVLYLCGVGSAIAVVLGHMARGEIKRSHGRVGGLGLATAGLVIGYFGLAFTLVLGGLAAVAALNDGVGTARQESSNSDSLTPSQPTPSQAPRQVAPAAGVCPDVSALDAVVPAGTELVLINSTRGVTDGVVDCLYTDGGRPPTQAPYVLVAVQDDQTTLSVEDYFADRSLDPPTAAQLGAAAGTADVFGFDSYDAPDSGLPYIDTAAARGERSAVLTVPAPFAIDDEVLFTTTVALLDAIRAPSNVV